MACGGWWLGLCGVVVGCLGVGLVMGVLGFSYCCCAVGLAGLVVGGSGLWGTGSWTSCAHVVVGIFLCGVVEGILM